jgi:hypothetical protein
MVRVGDYSPRTRLKQRKRAKIGRGFKALLMAVSFCRAARRVILRA